MAKLKWQLLVGLIVITVSGIMVTTDAGTGLDSPVPAQLLGFTNNRSELRFDVISNGCTSETDFVLEMEDESGVAYTTQRSVSNVSVEIVYLRLMRIKADKCRRRPARHAVSFPITELIKGRQVRLINTFVHMAQLKRE